MLNDYTFLTDHSYSLRPVLDDNDELPLKKREAKSPKRRQSSNRSQKNPATNNRKVSIDRSSSDKENSSSSSNASVSVTKTSPSTGSRRSRLSPRVAMNNSGKKQDNKSSTKTSGVKLSSGSVVKKKKANNRGKSKLLNIPLMDSSDAPPSLSIEERVKLRRTKAVQPTSSNMAKKKSTTAKKSQTRSTPKITKRATTAVKKTSKSFLGSGLDLDNIVLGNRQRRCAQT